MSDSSTAVAAFLALPVIDEAVSPCSDTDREETASKAAEKDDGPRFIAVGNGVAKDGWVLRAPVTAMTRSDAFTGKEEGKATRTDVGAEGAATVLTRFQAELPASLASTEKRRASAVVTKVTSRVSGSCLHGISVRLEDWEEKVARTLRSDLRHRGGILSLERVTGGFFLETKVTQRPLLGTKPWSTSAAGLSASLKRTKEPSRSCDTTS